MTSNRRIGSTRRSIALTALALVAVLATAAGTGLFTPRSADAQRSSSTERRGFLGVALQDLDEGLRDSYDYRGSGVLVSDVTEDSPADKVGIEEGDILYKLDDVAVTSADQVTERVRGLAPGTLVGVWVVRDGDTRYLGRAEIADLRTARAGDERIAPRAPRTPRAPRAVPAPNPAPRAVPAPDIHTILVGDRGRLGVETHDLDKDLGAYFQAPDGGGVLVLRVLRDTPAAKAGLKAGDVIRSVGGTKVDDTEELRRALRDRDAGDVELRVLRNGSERTITAGLEEQQAFDFQGMPGGGDWMSWFQDGDKDDDGDKDGKQIRKHIFRFRGDRDDQGDDDDDGKVERRIRVFRNLDDAHEKMSPEERERFDDEMAKLRDELKELRRELREIRNDRR